MVEQRIEAPWFLVRVQVFTLFDGDRPGQFALVEPIGDKHSRFVGMERMKEYALTLFLWPDSRVNSRRNSLIAQWY